MITLFRRMKRPAFKPAFACTPQRHRKRSRPCALSLNTNVAARLAYLAAWDVRRAKVFGRCETTTGIEPFDRLVQQVMEQEPYRKAPRVFWIVDNGSSHRGAAFVRRLQGDYPNLILIHLPVHASWLNQVEIYFSVIQRKVLTPNDFSSLAQVADRLLAFQHHYEQIAQPFEWKFTRGDLQELMHKITRPTPSALAAQL